MSLVAHRSTKFACASAVLLAVGLGAAAPSGAAVAFSVGATGSALTNQPVSALNNWQYNHNFWPDAEDGAVTDVTVIRYPSSVGIYPFVSMDESVQQGVVNLDLALRSLPPGTKAVVASESQGGLVVTRLLQQYEADPENAPDLSNVVFVYAGNPSAPTGLAGKDPGFFNALTRLTYPGPTPTYANGFMFSKEFDFFAYTPNNLLAAILNPVVAANYAASFLTVHPVYGDIDPDNLPAGTVVKKEGGLTHYIIPARVAPLLIPTEAGFKALGLGWVFDGLNQAMLNAIRPYYAANLEGYVPIESPSADPADLPESVSAQLRGENPEARFVSLGDEQEQVSSASSGDTKDVSIDSVQEPLKEPVAPQAPADTPKVIDDQQEPPVIESVKNEPEPEVQNVPQGAPDQGIDKVEDKSDESTNQTPKEADASDDKADESPKTTLRSGEGVKKSTLRSHRTPSLASSPKSDNDDSPGSPSASSPSGAKSSSASSASAGGASSSSNSSSNARSDNDD